MTQTIVNGAGMVIAYGTDDHSTRVVPIPPEQIPQHLSMNFVFAERGLGKHLVVGESRNKIFGAKSFDPRSEFFNHVTAYANEANSLANAQMIQRVVPTDAGPMSNIIMYLDVLETTVDRYQRLPDGSIATDGMGDPIITGTTPGLKVKWTRGYRNTVIDQEGFGNKTQAVGDQTDPDTLDTSIRYPVFELQNSWHGAAGDNTGFRLWAPTTAGGNSMPTKMMQKYQIYPYMISIIERPDSQTSPMPTKTIMGETKVMFTFKRDVVDPSTTQQLGWDQRVINSFNQIDVPGYPNVFGRVGKMFVYEDNIKIITELMHSYEEPFIDANADITEDVASAGLMNFVTGVSSKNRPYESFVFVDSQQSVRLSEASNIFLQGGSNGTMSNEMFEELVVEQLERYADPTDEVMDLAINNESIIYDSGFTLDTKFKLANFIGPRKDTFAVLGTHTVGGPELTAAQEHSIAISLRTRLQMFPESDYFGTPVMRALIMGRSGIIRDNEYTKRVPMTFEVLNKNARYMGASNGAWKSGFSPAGAPNHKVTRLKNINITWVPESVRNQNWDVGLNWVLRYNRSEFFIPHFKTVYDNDTSVLNSMFTALAIGQLNKIAHACWREFSGRDDLTPAQLCDRCNAFINERVFGKFDNRFVIIPEATLTDMDNLRGFSWTLPIKIGADNMRTVMTTWVEAYRKADLAPTAA